MGVPCGVSAVAEALLKEKQHPLVFLVDVVALAGAPFRLIAAFAVAPLSRLFRLCAAAQWRTELHVFARSHSNGPT